MKIQHSVRQEGLPISRITRFRMAWAAHKRDEAIRAAQLAYERELGALLAADGARLQAQPQPVQVGTLQVQPWRARSAADALPSWLRMTPRDLLRLARAVRHG